MKKGVKISLIVILVVIVALAAAVYALYGSRIRTLASIEKITAYADGYDLYRMNVEYDYSLDDVIGYGITDDQSFVQAIVKEALPLLPVNIKAPSFGCTAFTMTDADGKSTWAAITISKTTPPRCWCTAIRRTATNRWASRRWTI